MRVEEFSSERTTKIKTVIAFVDQELQPFSGTVHAWGAKMSGTGRGGLMLALTPTVELQEAVYAALTPLAPQVWKTTLA